MYLFIGSVDKRDFRFTSVMNAVTEVVERNTAALLTFKETIDRYGKELVSQQRQPSHPNGGT